MVRPLTNSAAIVGLILESDTLNGIVAASVRAKFPPGMAVRIPKAGYPHGGMTGVVGEYRPTDPAAKLGSGRVVRVLVPRPAMGGVSGEVREYPVDVLAEHLIDANWE